MVRGFSLQDGVYCSLVSLGSWLPNSNKTPLIAHPVTSPGSPRTQDTVTPWQHLQSMTMVLPCVKTRQADLQQSQAQLPRVLAGKRQQAPNSQPSGAAAVVVLPNTAILSVLICTETTGELAKRERLRLINQHPHRLLCWHCPQPFQAHPEATRTGTACLALREMREPPAQGASMSVPAHSQCKPLAPSLVTANEALRSRSPFSRAGGNGQRVC